MKRMLDLLFFEEVYQLCYKRSLFFLFVQHDFNKVAKARRVLCDRFRVLVHNVVE